MCSNFYIYVNKGNRGSGVLTAEFFLVNVQLIVNLLGLKISYSICNLVRQPYWIKNMISTTNILTEQMRKNNQLFLPLSLFLLLYKR